MVEVRYVKKADEQFWCKLDRHLPGTEFDDKIRTKRGYVLLRSNIPIGLL